MKTRDSKANKVLRTAALSKNRMPALPVIALYYSEAKDILSGVQDDPEYQEWRKDFTRLFFTAGHFIISEKGKKEDQSMYFSFNAKSRTPHFTVFDHEGTLMARFSADIDSDEIEHLMEPTLANSRFASGLLSFFGVPIEDVKEADAAFDGSEADRLRGTVGKYEKEANAIKSLPIMKGAFDASDDIVFDQHKRAWLDNKSKPEQDIVRTLMEQLKTNFSYQMRLGQMILAENEKKSKHLYFVFCDFLAKSVWNTFCSTMYYFHIRVPKFVDTQEVMTTEGYKKWNPDYNPIKRLQPPSVVRARNGTRSYLEQQRQRRTESWHVRGHLRRYKKTGLEVWITPYVKGTGDGLRLSVYADGVAATDVIENH